MRNRDTEMPKQEYHTLSLSSHVPFHSYCSIRLIYTDFRLGLKRRKLCNNFNYTVTVKPTFEKPTRRTSDGLELFETISRIYEWNWDTQHGHTNSPDTRTIRSSSHQNKLKRHKTSACCRSKVSFNCLGLLKCCNTEKFLFW